MELISAGIESNRVDTLAIQIFRPSFVSIDDNDWIFGREFLLEHQRYAPLSVVNKEELWIHFGTIRRSILEVLRCFKQLHLAVLYENGYFLR